MLEITEVGSYPLKCGLLDTNDAFILDTGAGGIFAWVGRGATANEKKAAFKNATVRGVSGRVLHVVKRSRLPLEGMYLCAPHMHH